MNRLTIFLYGTLTYVTFLATLLYAVGFIGNFAVPKSMDSPADDSWQAALLFDLGFLSLFAIYILVTIQLEERDLMAKHPEYIDYRRQVPMLVPGLPRHVVISTAAQSSHRPICGPFGDFV